MNDALLTGFWQGKNRFFTQRDNAPLLPSPACRLFLAKIQGDGSAGWLEAFFLQ
ncbi:hypothetical protein [uncultured Mitsuokella sp.]|uniref:hypothetical protein n=1 Tax=uncultured Mitsuokella sp. TaxID=453120 RepID=UPI0026158BD5|nr:hypothetical protein [uncultured Mitsuokella sp.]